MKLGFAITAVLVAITVAAAGGYWVGFREAWSMGVRADAAPRGSIAVWQLQLIDRGRIDDVRAGLEHDIDMGLILWHDLSTSHVAPFMNTLSGTEVVPEYEQYVRRIALYRKTHGSPLHDPARERSLMESSAKVSPEFAAEMKKGGDDARRALNEMVEKYGR